MNSPEVVIFNDADIKESLATPAAKFSGGRVEGIKTKIEPISRVDAVELELQRVERNRAIVVGDTFEA